MPRPRPGLLTNWIDRLALLLACAASAASLGCGDECLAFDYSPPSARFRLVDANTGDALCDRTVVVEANRGRPIPLDDLCEWWLPEWMTEEAIESGATSSEVSLSLAGYRERTVALPVTRNGCGEIQQPETVEVALEPE